MFQIHARAGLPPPPPPQVLARMMAPTQPPQHQPTFGITTGPTTVSAPPKVIPGISYQQTQQAKAPEEDDEDIFSKLRQYETQHKVEKKALKKAKKEGKLMTPASVVKTTATIPQPKPQPPPIPKPTSSFTPVPAASSQTPISATISDDSLKKAKKSKRMIRTGGGQVWEDESLKNWDPNDFRLFCGDLGNDVTDEVLMRTFGRYPSFQKAKVIRDKRTNKTRGYGFVSFKDPSDFTKAIRELNGKYVGSRPIKLRKSQWKERNIDIVRKKQKEKQAMGYKW